jgi:hypothetical protein
MALKGAILAAFAAALIAALPQPFQNNFFFHWESFPSVLLDITYIRIKYDFNRGLFFFFDIS